MIIAIDEVGDFAPYSQRNNFMVAVLLSQSGNHYNIKKQQFEQWQSKIDKSKFSRQNEVKGTELSEDELYSFVQNVILSDPIIRNVQIRIIPSENSEKLVQVFKSIEADVLKLLEDHYQNLQDPEGVTFFKKFRNWFKNRNFQHYVKMLMLQYCIVRSTALAIGVSQTYWANGDDTNLMSLAMKIDGDFINKIGEKKYFKELLAQSVRRITEEYPIPIAKQLIEANHPFAEQYIKGNIIELGELIARKCDFFNSHEHFELQIADILGTVLHRSQNRDSCHNCIDTMDKVLGDKGQIKVHLKLNEDPQNLVPQIQFVNEENVQ